MTELHGWKMTGVGIVYLGTEEEGIYLGGYYMYVGEYRDHEVMGNKYPHPTKYKIWQQNR